MSIKKIVIVAKAPFNNIPINGIKSFSLISQLYSSEEEAKKELQNNLDYYNDKCFFDYSSSSDNSNESSSVSSFSSSSDEFSSSNSIESSSNDSSISSFSSSSDESISNSESILISESSGVVIVIVPNDVEVPDNEPPWNDNDNNEEGELFNIWKMCLYTNIKTNCNETEWDNGILKRVYMLPIDKNEKNTYYYKKCLESGEMAIKKYEYTTLANNLTLEEARKIVTENKEFEGNSCDPCSIVIDKIKIKVEESYSIINQTDYSNGKIDCNNFSSIQNYEGEIIDGSKQAVLNGTIKTTNVYSGIFNNPDAQDWIAYEPCSTDTQNETLNVSIETYDNCKKWLINGESGIAAYVSWHGEGCDKIMKDNNYNFDINQKLIDKKDDSRFCPFGTQTIEKHYEQIEQNDSNTHTIKIDSITTITISKK